MSWLLEPLTYPFMQRGLLAAVIVGVVCAVIGVYVVLRGMAFFGDALAHAVLPGVALGYLVSGGGRENLFWWALGSAVLVSLAIGRLSRRAGIKEDTAIGIIFAGLFALGIALISTVRSYSVDLSHFLFGDVLGVSARDLWLTAAFGAVILLAIFLFYKEFLVLSFDPVLAATLRLPAGLLDNLLFVLMALTVSVAMQTVGVALMVAMLVTPAAAASLLTRRLWAMMLVSAAIGAFSALAGLYLSYYLNIVSGSAIVLTATLIFLLVFLFNPRQGVLRRKSIYFLLFTLLLTSCTSPLLPSTLAPQPPSPTAPPLPSTPTPSPTPTATPTPTPLPRPQYTLDLLLNYTRKAAVVEETILYPNATGESLPNLVLAVEPNLWMGGFSLQALTVDERPVSAYTLEGQRLEITLPQPLAPGSITKLALAFSLILPQMPAYSDPNDVRPPIYGYTARQVNLVDWYPFVVPYIPGADWVLHNPWFYGEHLVYDAADFDVTVRFGDASQPKVAASGAEAASATEAGRRFRLEAGRTFALSFSHLYEVQSETVDGITVHSYYFPYYDAAGEAVLHVTSQALQIYRERFGPYPYAAMTAVQGDFDDGMEFSGFYFLSRDFYNLYDGTPQNYLTIIAAHETAHQWWFDLVANDQGLEPWLDEALAAYSERVYYEQAAPDLVPWWWSYRVDFYQPGGALDTRIYDAGGYRAYTDAVYLNGAHFLEALRQRIGDEAFFAFIQNYLAQMRGKIATSVDFFAILRQHTSVDVSDIIGEYFENIP